MGQRDRVAVFGVEDGLVRRDEWQQRFALGVVVALFVEREVKVVDELGDQVERILEADRETTRVRLLRQALIEGEQVGGAEGDAERAAARQARRPRRRQRSIGITTPAFNPPRKYLMDAGICGISVASRNTGRFRG